MKFKEYLLEFSITTGLASMRVTGGDFIGKALKAHTEDRIVFYYTAKTGLVWSDFKGHVYKGKKKTGKKGAFSHGGLESLAGDWIQWGVYDETVSGRITRDKTILIWEPSGRETKKRKYIKNKAINAIYKYIGPYVEGENQ